MGNELAGGLIMRTIVQDDMIIKAFDATCDLLRVASVLNEKIQDELVGSGKPRDVSLFEDVQRRITCIQASMARKDMDFDIETHLTAIQATIDKMDGIVTANCACMMSSGDDVVTPMRQKLE